MISSSLDVIIVIIFVYKVSVFEQIQILNSMFGNGVIVYIFASIIWRLENSSLFCWWMLQISTYPVRLTENLGIPNLTRS